MPLSKRRIRKNPELDHACRRTRYPSETIDSRGAGADGAWKRVAAPPLRFDLAQPAESTCMSVSESAQPRGEDRLVIPKASVIALTGLQLGVAGALLFAAFVAVFWVFFSTQVRWALEEPADWGHTLFVPVIAGYFIYLKRAELIAAPARACWFGAPIVVLGVAAYVATTFGPSWFVLHHNARGLAVGITLLGLCLLLLGTRMTKVLLFPLGYWIVFGQSISERLLQKITEDMQDWSAVGAHVLLGLTGVDVERSGNVLTVYVNGAPNQLNVAEACSGMRMLVAFIALGVAIAYTGLPRTWQRIALVAAGFPVAIGVNVLRVYTLGILSLFDSGFAAGDFHSFVGLVWLVPALVLYLGIMWFLRNLFVEDAKASKGPKGKGATNAP
jgi:exosortase